MYFKKRIQKANSMTRVLQRGRRNRYLSLGAPTSSLRHDRYTTETIQNQRDLGPRLCSYVPGRGFVRGVPQRGQKTSWRGDHRPSMERHTRRVAGTYHNRYPTETIQRLHRTTSTTHQGRVRLEAGSTDTPRRPYRDYRMDLSTAWGIWSFEFGFKGLRPVPQHRIRPRVSGPTAPVTGAVQLWTEERRA